MYTKNVTPEAIARVKKLVKKGVSIRQAAIAAGISYHAAWSALNGRKPVPVNDGFFEWEKCVITGFCLSNS